MKELPILFSADMVKALLAERKTMTRRTVKKMELTKHLDCVIAQANSSDFEELLERTITESDSPFQSPYGKPGDILYVRENWRPRDYVADGPELLIEYKADGKDLYFYPEDELAEKIEASMIAECQKKGLNIENYGRFVYKNFPISWRPSIHLPKELSRIWLQIGEIRVQRLNDITEDDAIDEGIGRIFMPDEPVYYQHYGAGNIEGTTDPIESYQSLWNSINGSNSWDANPWVWVVKYKMLSTTGRDDIPSEILLQLDGKEAI